METAFFHLPGLFEFYNFYKVFLPLFFEHKEYFYDWCQIGSIYGAPGNCLWGGGRVGFGEANPKDVKALMNEYNLSARLTFSNSLLNQNHLNDRQSNELCKIFSSKTSVKNGIIIYSDLLLNYIKTTYPDFYFISSTTKVITDFDDLKKEINNKDFEYVVPDFRLNKRFYELSKLSENQKTKVEFLCNENCFIGCNQRKICYENVCKKALGEKVEDFVCKAPGGQKGYVFSNAMKNPAFISIEDIQNIYLPMGFNNFKIEGRSLGSAILLEFILYYMTKTDYQLKVREAIYLDSSLDLF